MMLPSSPPHLTPWTLEDGVSFKRMMSMSVKQKVMSFERCDCISEIGPQKEWRHPHCQMQPAVRPAGGTHFNGKFI